MFFNVLFCTASSDYQELSVPLTFAPDLQISRSMCENISIVPDEIVENPERFRVQLNSTDLGVETLIGSAVVTLQDSSSE